MGNAGSAIECCGPCSVDKTVSSRPARLRCALRVAKCTPHLCVVEWVFTRRRGALNDGMGAWDGFRHGGFAIWRM